MKKIILAVLLFCTVPGVSHGETIDITFPDGWRDVIEDSVINLEDWINKAIKGKYNKCASRVVDKEVKLSIEAEEEIPAGQEAIIQKHFNRPGYENREQREKTMREKGR